MLNCVEFSVDRAIEFLPRPHAEVEFGSSIVCFQQERTVLVDKVSVETLLEWQRGVKNGKDNEIGSCIWKTEFGTFGSIDSRHLHKKSAFSLAARQCL